VKTKKPHRRSKWKDSLLIPVYEMARSGMKNNQIAHSLGITTNTFNQWIEKKSVLADALKQARSSITGRAEEGGSLRQFIYKRLPPTVKAKWDELFALEKQDGGWAKQLMVLEQCTRKMRQHLFFFALVHFAFSASEACRFIGISKSILHGWCQDRDFRELMDEIDWHKGNFYESGLVKLIRKGDSAATIFANKTFNKNRGYNDKVVVEHTQKDAIPIEALDSLPLKVRKQILAALEHHERGGVPALEDSRNVIEGEFEERS
jgi:hypothetical protein